MAAWTTVRAHAAAAGGHPETLPSMMKDDFAGQVLFHLVMWPAKTPGMVLLVVPGIAIGIWAARRRIIDDPEQHVALLRRDTFSFLALAVVGRLPMALISAGAWTTDSTWPMAWAPPPYTPSAWGSGYSRSCWPTGCAGPATGAPSRSPCADCPVDQHRGPQLTPGNAAPTRHRSRGHRRRGRQLDFAAG
jgi:hypothetical protein